MTLSIDLTLDRPGFTLSVSLPDLSGPVAIVGPNGSGKSTVLRLLAGALRPDRGRIALNGVVLCDVDAGCFVPPEHRGVGYLPQGGCLFPHLSSRDNVAFGLRGGRRARRAAADELLASVGAADLGDRLPAQLSGGQAQRVAIARAIAPAPRLLLLDEPSAALDVTARRVLRTVLSPHLRAPDRMTVLVSHDIRDLMAWQPHIIVLEDGRVTAQGDLKALSSVARPFLRELLAPLSFASAPGH